MLEEIGLEGERLDMFFMSGGQGRAFAEAAEEMTNRIKKIGPNPLKNR
jgi:F420-non-reducing hydrogenase iron-sulfur subunit